MKNSVDKREKVFYLSGMFGQNMIYAVMSTGLTFYFQSVIFLPAMAISVITIISKILEFISDPVMGHMIDITKTKYGKCRPYLLFVPLPVCICSILVFMNYQYTLSNSLLKNIFIILWAGVSTSLFGVVYSVGDVSIWAFPSLMTRNSSERNKILADAKIVSTIGGSLIVLIVLQLSQYAGNIFAEKIGDNARGLQTGTILVCITIIIIGSILFQLTGLFTKERNKSSQSKSSLRESFAIIWKCKPFRYIMISGILRGPYMLINIVQNVLYIYYFGNNGQTPYITYMVINGGLSMVGQLLASSVLPKFSEKYDKVRLFVAFNIISAVSLFSVFILYLSVPDRIAEVLPFAIFTFIMFVFSFALGVVFTLQSFMIGDTVDYEESVSGYRHDGVFFSGQSLLVKISTGISSVISGVIYTIVGFSADNLERINTALYNGASFRADPEFAEYRFALFFMLSVIPALGFILSIIPMKKYSLYEKE